MVKRLKFEDFLYELDGLYSASRDKYSVYLTFKRIYDEKFKYKQNKKICKLRREDRKGQDKVNERFNVLVRARLKKKRIQTSLTHEELDKFHHILMNVLTLHFIREENKKTLAVKKMPIKKMSRTQRRKMKRLRKLKQVNEIK